MTNHFKLIPLEERIVLDGAAATVIYVNVHSPASAANQTGADWAHAWSNLQSALSEAATHPGDQIWVAKGTYLPSTTGDPTATFNIPNQTSIYGGFTGKETQLSQANPEKNLTILSGNLLGNNTDDSYTIVTIGSTASETVTLDGLTITDANNTLTGLGGGLAATNGSTVTLSNMTFSNDTANTSGGGVYVSGDNSITILNSNFNGNNSLLGGGVYAENTNNATVTSSTFEHNTAYAEGGGFMSSNITNVAITFNNFIYNSGSNPGYAGDGGAVLLQFDHNDLVSYNNFDHNVAEDPLTHLAFGGALEVSNFPALSGHTNNMTVSFNSFTNNIGDEGGAMQVIGLTRLNIYDNLFLNNTATVAGGAMDLGHGIPGFDNFFPPDQNVYIKDNIFINNAGGQLGGAIGAGLEMNLVIIDNLFANNSAVDGGAIGDLSSVALTITDNIFAGNSATQGNSVWLQGGETTVNGVTVTPTNQSALIDQLVDDNIGLLSDNIFIA